MGCGGRKGRREKRYERRCRKVCWGVGEVRVDVGKGEGREEMRGSRPMLGPHTLTHFSTHPPFLSPHPLPTRQHISPLTPYTLPHPSPHIFPCLLPHPNTLPYTSHHIPHTSSHSYPHQLLHPNSLPTHPCTFQHLSPHLPPQLRLCGEVTM